MSRYIDADAVKNIIRSGVSTDTEADQEYVCERVVEAPSIDIVRCRECVKRKKNKFCLEHMRYERNDNGFCSYGERKEK